MGSSKKVASGVFWSTLMNVVNAVYGFVSVPILINYFGKAEYGLIGLALSVNVYMQLMDLGFNSTNVRFFSSWLAKGEHDNVRKLFQTSLAFYGTIGLINAIIVISVTFFSKQLFHLTPEQDVILRNMFYVLAISAIISWYSSCFEQVVRATENVAWIQRMHILPKLLMMVILFATVSFKISIGWYFFLSTFAVFTIVPLTVRKIKKELPFMSFTPRFNLPILKTILPYCLNIFSFGLFQFSFYNLRPVFLGLQGSVESVADFRILNGIVSGVSLFGSSFMTALLPSSAKAVAQNNNNASYRVAYDATKYICITLCFCAFGMMTVGRDVLSLYVGESYLYLMPWLNIWLLCTLGVHNQAISSLILAGTDIRAITYNTIVSSIIGLILSWTLISKYQIGGIVIAFVAYLLIQYTFYYLYYWPKHMHINSWRVFSRSFLPYVIIGGLIYLLIDKCMVLESSHTVNFIVKGFTFAVLYVVVVILTSSKTDKDFFMNLVSKKKK